MAHRRTFELALRWIACGLALAAGGCFAPRNRPWLGPNEPAVLHQPTGVGLPGSDPSLEELNKPRAGSIVAPKVSAATPAPDPRALQDVIVQLQTVGAVDPAAQAKLLEDLERTNPSLWPEVMQSFRARRTAQAPGLGELARTDALSPTGASALPLTSRLTSSSQPASPWSALEVPPITKNDQVVLKEWPQPAPAAQTGRVQLAAGVATPTNDAPWPQPPAVVLTEGGLREPGRLNLDNGQVSPSSNAISSRNSAAPPFDAAVRPASFTVPASTGAPANQDAALAAAIAGLEATLQEPVKNSTDVPRHAYLRLLYLSAGRREDALRPIAGLSPTEQEYWDKQLRAMATWLDVERIPDAPRRAAEASQRLTEATARLAQLSSLGVRNMAFCTEVSSYGVYTRFKENNFTPGQQVLLYAEVENFKSVETHRGFHTMLKTSYQILDSSGTPVVKDEPQAMEEYCQNPRRDYFVRYRLHLPKGITSGRYRLQLTIEDTLGAKSGVSNIEFTVTAP